MDEDGVGSRFCKSIGMENRKLLKSSSGYRRRRFHFGCCPVAVSIFLRVQSSTVAHVPFFLTAVEQLLLLLLLLRIVLNFCGRYWPSCRSRDRVIDVIAGRRFGGVGRRREGQ